MWVGEDLLTYATDRVSVGVYVLKPTPELATRFDDARRHGSTE